jgi:endonuclease/exonuclease/phosphatase family protein
MLCPVGRRLSVIDWNLRHRVGSAAIEQAKYIASFEPDLVLFQEAHQDSIAALCDGAGLDWFRFSLDHRVVMPWDGQRRQLGCAIGGRGIDGGPGRLITDVPVPERTLVVDLSVDGAAVIAGSFHAPTGVSWFEKKPAQAVKIAQWLEPLTGPVIIGMDANTPEVDHPDFAQTRTHWHTGDANLSGAPGDDQLVGPAKIHPLTDALRDWLETRSDELDAIRGRTRDAGPLATSFRTGARKGSPGTPHRYDSIWTHHCRVESIEYHYDEGCRLSDHALVHAVLELEP